MPVRHHSTGRQCAFLHQGAGDTAAMRRQCGDAQHDAPGWLAEGAADHLEKRQ
jgi:hypothetical protein